MTLHGRHPAPSSGVRAGLRFANEPLGVLALVFLGVGAATGLAVWARLTVGAGTAATLIALHAYVGLVGLPIVMAKTAAGLAAWWRPGPRAAGTAGTGHQLMTALLVAVVVSLYGSGVLMYANAGQGGVLKTVHLWSAVTGVPVVSYHVWRFGRRARTVVSRAVAEARRPGAQLGRRHLLVVGTLALLGWGTTRVTGGLVDDLRHRGPNDFPVTLTSGGDDQPDPQLWRMRVGGDVSRPLQVSLEDLRAGPVERHRYSLDCVLGWSVTRTWGGVPLRHLLAEAGASPDLVSVVVRSTTGYQVALLAPQVLDPRTMVAWEVDGVDLTPEHGFPARIMAPDVIGELCVKWVDDVTVVAA